MNTAEIKLAWHVLSSLEKVFPDSEIECASAGKIPVFPGARGETIAFQIAFRSQTGIYLKLRTETGLKNLRMREVCLVPCEMPSDPNDPGILRSKPGLYPDPLRDIREPLRLAPNITRAVWFSVRPDEKMKP